MQDKKKRSRFNTRTKVSIVVIMVLFLSAVIYLAYTSFNAPDYYVQIFHGNMYVHPRLVSYNMSVAGNDPRLKTFAFTWFIPAGVICSTGSTGDFLPHSADATILGGHYDFPLYCRNPYSPGAYFIKFSVCNADNAGQCDTLDNFLYNFTMG